MTARKLAPMDLETFSERPLNKGTHQYAEKAEVLLYSFATGDGPPDVWDVASGDRMPNELEDLLRDERVLTVWHNGRGFDLVVLKYAMPDIYAMLPIERVYDTMLAALAHGLPGSLDALGEIFNIKQEDRKLKTGKEFINLFCKMPPKNVKRGRATRLTHPTEWQGFKEYSKQDIPSMRAILKALPKWNMPYEGSEMDLSRLDYKINDRGFLLDLNLAHSAIRAIDRAQKSLSERTVELTEGEVARATQRDKLLAYLLAEHGVELPDLQKSTLETRINDTALPWQVRELLAIRLQASASSTSKYRTAILGASSDGRMRGTLQMEGASRTRRWAGRLIQPTNMLRPKLPKEISKQGDEAVEAYIEMGISAMKADCEDLIFDNVMQVAANSMRGIIIAPPGKKLVVADLSGIENRDAAWLADEKWKLRALAEFDAGHGEDLYVLEYAKSFSADPATVTKYQRLIGKVLSLSMQYAGGVGAFMSMALIYGIDLEDMAEHTYDMLPSDVLKKSQDFYEWTVRKKRSTFGLSQKAFVVCETLKRMWRLANSAIVTQWGEIQDAIVQATTSPGVIVHCGKTRMVRRGAWLRIRLPSGNFLVYPSPQVDDKGQFSYLGVSPYSRKWGRQKAFGGKIFNSFCQGLARDIMAANMQPAEDAGYEIVLTVHDEIVCEAPDTPEYNHEHLSSILATVPSWALGMPLAAAGFESYRYRK